MSYTSILKMVYTRLLIPYLSYNGTAITTVLSYILIVVLQIYVIYKIGQDPMKKIIL